jgi:histidine triad (HIT) family protein
MHNQKNRKSDCIFCKIVDGTIPSPRLFENEQFICIKDVQPHAKTHLLIIPREHIESLETAFPAQGAQQAELLGKMMEFGTRVARESGLLPKGFRSVINTGADGGQTVFHLHLHILGGQALSGKLA